MDYRLTAGRTTIGRADSCDIALPGDTISRLHCIVQGRGENWKVLDKSRHGVCVSGKRIEESAPHTTTKMSIGPYQVEFIQQRTEAVPTAAQETDLSHELMHTYGDEIVVERAVLIVEQGSLAGHRVTLASPRVSVGGHGQYD